MPLSYRWPLAAVGLLACVAAERTPGPVPSKEQVARWVQQLGDNDFQLREEASRRLWEAGQAAEAALQGVADSPDAEVSRRARLLLDRFKWGIYPNTPKKIVELIERYQAGGRGGNNPVPGGIENAGDRMAIGGVIKELFENGAPGCRAVLKIARAEEEPGIRRRLFAQIANEMPRAIPMLVNGDDLDTLELLLETSLDNDIQTGVGHYVAYVTLRGKLDERIAKYQALTAKNAGDKKAWEVLAYLYRANNNPAESRIAAEKAGRPELLNALLFEAGAWKELAARPIGGETTHDVERLGLKAAYHRLAGQTKEFEADIASLRKLADEGKDDEGTAFLVAKVLFLNDRPAEALALLQRGGNEPLVFEVLAAQMKMGEALKIVEQARKAKSTQLPEVEILAARVLYGLGEKDKAKEIFARYGAEIKTDTEVAWYETLVDSEVRAGLDDMAIVHAAKIIGLSKDQGWLQRLLPKLFPDKEKTAQVWWDVLRERETNNDAAAVLKQIADILNAKVPRRQITELVQGAVEARKKINPQAEMADQWSLTLAEAAAASGNEELARSTLEKATTSGALVKLGDLLADKKDWEAAAEQYRRAWEKDRQKPLPLFLWGRAQQRAGQEKEGKRRVEQAHLLPLGNEATRHAFVTALTQRELMDESRYENSLLLRLSQPASYYAGEAQRRIALDASSRKDYLKAAAGHEQAMLRCMRPYINFVQGSAYVGVPGLIHRQRARGCLATGKIDEALREIALARAATPGSVDLILQAVPGLEKAGRSKEAGELYKQVGSVLESICQDFPRSAWAHNSVAWMAACCRRDLDNGLIHATKATELMPDGAGYFDTLAEVYFQRGEKDKAATAQKKAIELDPKKTYYRKQLSRIEAGNPAAPRPAEDDQDDEE